MGHIIVHFESQQSKLDNYHTDMPFHDPTAAPISTKYPEFHCQFHIFDPNPSNLQLIA